jgi:hypothetical protein
MQVMVKSDHNITGDVSLTDLLEAILSDSIGHFAKRILKVQAFLSGIDQLSQERNHTFIGQM